jgi:hypothetical protein
MSAVGAREWTYLRAALVVVAVLAVADVAAWKVHDWRHPPPTRLESTVRCFEGEKGVLVTVPAGDPLSASAAGGSLRTTVEGNGVIVVLAGSEEQARKLEQTYRDVGGDLSGRLERRDRTVYLWDRPSSPTQRQATYDCQY